MNETTDPDGISWTDRAKTPVERDKLRMRLDIYEESLILKCYELDATWTRLVDADRIAAAFTLYMGTSTGLLPPSTLWWKQSQEGVITALWREPQVWNAALQVKAFEPPERFRLPMPGLLFIAAPGRAPWAFAARKRPEEAAETLFNIPTFNVFRNGRVCPGNHRFPDRADETPEPFFQSHFSMTGDTRGRSKRHPNELYQLWQELDGKEEYPLEDLVEHCIDLEPGQVETVAELLTDMGIRFDPVENMIAMPRDNVEEKIFTGRDGEWVQERINERLEETVNPHRVTQPFHEMTLPAKRDLLMLATIHCDWHKNEIQEMNQREWEIFREQHPEAVSPTAKA